MPSTQEARRLLNQWNAARHGWDRFQTGSQRAALRIALAGPAADLDTTQPGRPHHPARPVRSPMDARARIHALLPTEETEAELDVRLREYRKEVVEHLLHAVEYSLGDEAAEHLKIHNPELEAWLEGRDAD
ncbi:hypothetical protein [Streptomyces sp. bgisy022]|uniref:hypothetical protein n=1 Tax=Streptomyces sp. bgisy022 TaxID=3413769 RepID=UPI003D72AEE1